MPNSPVPRFPGSPIHRFSGSPTLRFPACLIAKSPSRLLAIFVILATDPAPDLASRKDAKGAKKDVKRFP